MATYTRNGLEDEILRIRTRVDELNAQLATNEQLLEDAAEEAENDPTVTAAGVNAVSIDIQRIENELEALRITAQQYARMADNYHPVPPVGGQGHSVGKTKRKQKKGKTRKRNKRNTMKKNISAIKKKRKGKSAKKTKGRR
jgi:hypothetical protein